MGTVPRGWAGECAQHSCAAGCTAQRVLKLEFLNFGNMFLISFTTDNLYKKKWNKILKSHYAGAWIPFSQIGHYHLGCCIDNSFSSPVFTSPPPAALVLASLRRSCFSWRFPCPVDHCCSCIALLVSTKRTAASCFSWRFPCPVDHCCPCSALLVSTKRTADLPWRGPDHCPRTCYPSAHPRTCYPSARYARAP